MRMMMSVTRVKPLRARRTAAEGRFLCMREAQ